MWRHEFLARAHEILRPEVYLEVGVQTGGSLALAERAGLAIGVDPAPVIRPEHERANQRIYAQTSAEYFACESCERPTIDFAYIDGSHLYEDALLDFINIEAHTGPASVVMFDDVLPYSAAIATREQPAGDWTGDVWKVILALAGTRPDLGMATVDVAPTGLLIVTGLNRHDLLLEGAYGLLTGGAGLVDQPPPDAILNRTHAVDAETALEGLRQWKESH